MSMSDTLRRAIAANPGLGLDALVPHVPEAESREQVAKLLSALASRGEIARAGEPRAYTYTITEAGAARGEANHEGEAAPARKTRKARTSKLSPPHSRGIGSPFGAAKKAATKRGKKARKTPAPASRAASTAVARIEPDTRYHVGLQIDGSIMVHDTQEHTFDSVPAPVVRQIVALGMLATSGRAA